MDHISTLKKHTITTPCQCVDLRKSVHYVDLVLHELLVSLTAPPSQVQHASLTLGEVLAGDRKAVSDYDIGFLESFDEKTLCTVELGEDELNTLREAIEDLYYFEFTFGNYTIFL